MGDGAGELDIGEPDIELVAELNDEDLVRLPWPYAFPLPMAGDLITFEHEGDTIFVRVVNRQFQLSTHCLFISAVEERRHKAT